MSGPSPSRSVFLEDAAQAGFDEARVAILPVPFESTVTFGRGTSRGPAAILDASEQLELYDEQMDAEPYRCGVWTAPPLTGNDVDAEAMAGIVERRFGELLDAGKWVVMLGGEHSITPGAVRAAATRHEGLQVVQLDAHADLRESYQGNRWSHACAMARCIEVAPVRAIGVRSYSREEAQRIRADSPGYRITHAWETEEADWIELALEGLRKRPVYLTIDLDYFDPAIMPSTGTPEPGGGRWGPALQLLERLFREARVVAADIVELAPIVGLHHPDFTAARLVYKLIAFACGGASGGPAPRGSMRQA